MTEFYAIPDWVQDNSRIWILHLLFYAHMYIVVLYLLWPRGQFHEGFTMFRVVTFVDFEGSSIQLASQAFGSVAMAERFLEMAAAIPGYTGGRVDQRVDPFGWVIVEG